MIWWSLNTTQDGWVVILHNTRGLGVLICYIRSGGLYYKGWSWYLNISLFYMILFGGRGDNSSGGEVFLANSKWIIGAIR